MTRKIYHITHIDNLPGIIRNDRIWSDASGIRQGLECRLIGLSDIKRRRREELEVHCHPGTKVGEYVPFYFCPRSIMLYILHKGNHTDITYRGGQEPIIHLQADLQNVIDWAEEQGIPWAFSDRNAGTYFAHFSNSGADLDQLDWNAINNNDFRDLTVKEGKQAEFLFYDSFPWSLVEYVGILNRKIESRVRDELAGSGHNPGVGIKSSWYF